MFFKVEHFRPSALKRARGDMSENFNTRNIAISRLHAESSSDGLSVYARTLPQHSIRKDSQQPQALAILNEAFFDGECFTIWAFEAGEALGWLNESLTFL